MTKERKAGVLLPISSLPAPYGIGTMGESAYRFIDWLKAAGMKLWQVLPLLPTNYGDSPYQSCASDALNYYFIDLDALEREGLLEKADYAFLDWGADPRRVDYEKLFLHRAEVLKKAFARFDRTASDWKKFLKTGKYRDFALFMSLKSKFSYLPWTEWPEPYRLCDEKTIGAFMAENGDELEFWQFTQYLFLRQWNALKAYAHENGVEIMGDMPIYVASDSVEMWKYRGELFLLDEKGAPAAVAGVPPDAFSADGQLWGNPVYDWEKLKGNGYAWWHARIDYALTLFDILRIDHFRGFDRFYAIPAGAADAKEGEWLKGPGAALFEGRKGRPIVAEDLGIIDEGVRKMLKETGYPGMKVLEFAFDGNPDNDHKPSHYGENCIAYTGTHDNEPLLSYIEGLDETARRTFEEDLRRECGAAKVPVRAESASALCKTTIRLLFSGKSFAAVVPMKGGADQFSLHRCARKLELPLQKIGTWKAGGGMAESAGGKISKIKGNRYGKRRNIEACRSYAFKADGDVGGDKSSLRRRDKVRGGERVYSAQPRPSGERIRRGQLENLHGDRVPQRLRHDGNQALRGGGRDRKRRG